MNNAVFTASMLEEKISGYTCAVSLVGGAPVLCGASPLPVEVYNDIDSTVAFFFECLRRPDRKQQLKDLLQDYTDLEKEVLLSIYRNQNLAQVVRLSAWVVYAVQLLRLKLQKLGRKKLFNRGKGDYTLFSRDVAEKLYAELEEIDPILPDLHGRLFRMQVEHYPVEKTVQIYDSPETVFIVDEDHDEDREGTREALRGAQGSAFYFAV